MTRRKTTGGKGARKLALKKETVKDLDLKGRAKNVKGGLLKSPTQSCVCLTYLLSCKCLATGGC